MKFQVIKILLVTKIKKTIYCTVFWVSATNEFKFQSLNLRCAFKNMICKYLFFTRDQVSQLQK